MSDTTRYGVSAAASRDPACVTPCANPRSAGRIQRESERVAIGNAPASPIPNRNRTVAIDPAIHAIAVIDVNTDHHATIRVSARRGPIRSPSHPPGIWNSAYAQLNAEITQPIVIMSKPSSLRIVGTADEIDTRSMYVIMYAATVSARTTWRTRVGRMGRLTIVSHSEFTIVPEH